MPLPYLTETATYFLRNHRKNSNRMLHGSFADYEGLLRSYNQDLGFDVYWAVNRTDGLGRRTENITHLRAFYADYDHGAPGAWGPIEPSVVVESSPGRFQAYWLLRSPVPLNPTTSEMYLKSLRHLVHDTGADDNARDIARILRVPGYVNYGKLASVRVVKDDGATTPFADFCTAWPGLPDDRKAFVHMQAPRGWAEPATLPPEAERIQRYVSWLRAAGWPPAGLGQRNGFLFRSAAAGLRDFALEGDFVISALEAEASVRYPNDWEELEIERITRNASRSASAPLGCAYQETQIVMEE